MDPGLKMKQLTKDIINLRYSGKTYKEICKNLKCSKSHISYICKKYIENNRLIVAENSKNIDKGPSLKKALIGAAKYYQNKEDILINEHLVKMQKYKNQSFLYYICGLYEGEGNHSGTECKMSNSDYKLIKQFIIFATDVLKKEITVTLQIHKSHDKNLCLKFWNEKGISIKYIRQHDNRKQKKDNKNRENYGTINVRIIKPWGIRKALIANYSFPG